MSNNHCNPTVYEINGKQYVLNREALKKRFADVDRLENPDNLKSRECRKKFLLKKGVQIDYSRIHAAMHGTRNLKISDIEIIANALDFKITDLLKECKEVEVMSILVMQGSIKKYEVSVMRELYAKIFEFIQAIDFEDESEDYEYLFYKLEQELKKNKPFMSKHIYTLFENTISEICAPLLLEETWERKYTDENGVWMTNGNFLVTNDIRMTQMHHEIVGEYWKKMECFENVIHQLLEKSEDNYVR